MASTRLQTLKNRLDLYIACEKAIIDGAQSYEISGKNLTRADLQKIADMIKYLEKEISAEESRASGKGRNRVIGVIPRDF